MKGRQFKALARVSQRTRAKAEVNNHAIGFSQSSSFFSEQQERVWEEGYSYFIKVFPLSNLDVDFSLDNFLLMLGSYNINNLDCSIYATQSHLNHNCDPNTEVDSGETRGSFGIKVLSSRFISAGEELTTTYVNPLHLFKDRQNELRVNWGFICKCKRCKSCLLYTSPSPRDLSTSRMPSSA